MPKVVRSLQNSDHSKYHYHNLFVFCVCFFFGWGGRVLVPLWDVITVLFNLLHLFSLCFHLIKCVLKVYYEQELYFITLMFWRRQYFGNFLEHKHINIHQPQLRLLLLIIHKIQYTFGNSFPSKCLLFPQFHIFHERKSC